MTSSSTSHIASSGGLRSRKIDVKRRLRVLAYDAIDDLEGLESGKGIGVRISGHSSTTNLTTGVEKGEDEEHHLQAAIISRHAVVIPTPDASALASLPAYEKYYSDTFTIPHNLIKVSEDVLEEMGCLYNIDDADRKWLEEIRSKDGENNDHESMAAQDSNATDANDKEPPQKFDISDFTFEYTMCFFDDCGNEKVSGESPALSDCLDALEKDNVYKSILESVSKYALSAVYEYWRKARYQINGGRTIRHILKSEDMSATPDTDPYVCFRIRETKIHRKVRRSDTLALDKLRKLKQDMRQVKLLLDICLERELARKEIIVVGQQVFENRVIVRRLKRFLGINTADALDASPEKTRKRTSNTNENSKIRIPLHHLREAASLVNDMDAYLFEDRINGVGLDDHRVQEKVRRERDIQEKSGWFPFSPPPAARYWGSHLGIESQAGDSYCYSSRRRVGRGGRIVFDRHVQFNRPSINQRPGDPVDPPTIISDNISSMLYRGYFLNQPTKGDSQLLHNKPAHTHSFDPTKIPALQQPPPTDAIRVSNINAAGATVKHRRPPKGAEKTPNAAVRKKNDEAKAEQVKMFLKASQQHPGAPQQGFGQAGPVASGNEHQQLQTSGFSSPATNVNAQNPTNPGFTPNTRLGQMLMPNQSMTANSGTHPTAQQQMQMQHQFMQNQIALLPPPVQAQFLSLNPQQQVQFFMQLTSQYAGGGNSAAGMQNMQRALFNQRMGLQMHQQLPPQQQMMTRSPVLSVSNDGMIRMKKTASGTSSNGVTAMINGNGTLNGSSHMETKG